VVHNKHCFITKRKSGKVKLWKSHYNKKTKLLDLENGLANKVFLVKSHTGSGKTTALKQIVAAANHSSMSIKSLCSRRTLARFHSSELELDYYKDLSYKDSWNTVACQIDSIMKMKVVPDEKSDEPSFLSCKSSSEI